MVIWAGKQLILNSGQVCLEHDFDELNTQLTKVCINLIYKEMIY
jgi:hypothetical protein